MLIYVFISLNRNIRGSLQLIYTPLKLEEDWYTHRHQVKSLHTTAKSYPPDQKQTKEGMLTLDPNLSATNKYAKNPVRRLSEEVHFTTIKMCSLFIINI